MVNTLYGGIEGIDGDVICRDGARGGAARGRA